ncbi:hypothetical protein GU700_17290 [Methylobacterium sp. NI91]|nr:MULTISPECIES: hypothetical protein [unclassified Methylobacterium]QIJ76191.1 hypothetical protein CLZ_17285 [Methylobacterium sp. CLZ]QIJ81096.1 hypothetical protein GU700_17290 [Methylobacterium sp. NI91]
MTPHPDTTLSVGGAKERARPLAEWTEEDGDVLWWRFPITEPPYVGSPLDCGKQIEITISEHGRNDRMSRYWVGGWPDYHTHWTPIPCPEAPADTPTAEGERA